MKKNTMRRRLLIDAMALPAVTLAGLLGAGSAVAQAPNAPSYEFNLPSQRLSASLRELALQAGMQIYYEQALVEPYRAAGLSGRFSFDSALRQLLAGTGLDYELINDKTVVVKRGAAPKVQAAPAPASSTSAAPHSAPKPVAAAAPAPVLEEVMVTATKREESLQSTPIAVTAVTGEQIEKSQLPAISDIAQKTPNMNISMGQSGGSSTVQAYIRGVGESDYMITTDPAVALYLDGVYLARTSGANFSLADVGQVEVLRGPQGTLFGKNAIGGAINVVTRKPTGDTEGLLELSYGSYGFVGSRGYVQLPLVQDKLFMSLSAMTRRSDGWQQRPVGGNGGAEDKMAGRLTLRWLPGPDFESMLSIDGTHQAQPSYANVILSINPGAPTMAVYNFAGLQPPCCSPNSEFHSGDDSPLARDDVYAHGITWTNQWFASDTLTVKSISAYRHTDADFGQDYDHSEAVFYAFGDQTQHLQYSQEFQFLGKAFDDRLKWVGGLYYFYEEGEDHSLLDVIPAAVAAHVFGLDLNVDAENEQKTESKAVFAQFDYDLRPDLTVGLGVRFTRENKYFVKHGIRRVTGAPQFTPGSVPPSSDCSVIGPADQGAPFHCDATWNAFTPKADITYHINADVMAYVQASRGFRSGGFNGRPTALSLITSYDPEYLLSYEGGIKADFFDHRLRTNAAVFYSDYTDKQQTVNVADPSTGTVALTVNNAGAARIQGFELETSAIVTPAFQLDWAVGYTDARFTKWYDALQGDLTDRHFANTPRWTSNLGAEYGFNLDDYGRLSLRADANFRSDVYLDAENTDILRSASYTMINGSLRWMSTDGQWEAILSGKNLTNKKALLSGFNGANFFGIVTGNYTAPRLYFLTLRYHL